MDGDGFGLSSARITIVGLGLMGASLAMDLRGHCGELIGVSRSPQTLKYAVENRIVDQVVSFVEGLDCDLLVLAAPIRTILGHLKKMAEAALPDQPSRRTIVLDVGSTKATIVEAMRQLPERFDPIGGHPMCGKEVAGIQYAQKGLYRDKVFVLTTLERTSPKALFFVQDLISVIGARPFFLSGEQQDAMVAVTSHLPYLAASALMQTALMQADERVWKMAASGFRDTSRLAASDVTMMIDILLTNKESILDALKEYRSNLDTLTDLVASGDESGLRAFLSVTQNKRAQLFMQEE
jgi:prephenate dehydrogenase